jgi:hypothetical protein
MNYPAFKQIFGPVSIAEAELQRILNRLIEKDRIVAVPPQVCIFRDHGPGQSQSYLDKASVRISGRNEIFLARMMKPLEKSSEQTDGPRKRDIQAASLYFRDSAKIYT